MQRGRLKWAWGKGGRMATSFRPRGDGEVERLGGDR